MIYLFAVLYAQKLIRYGIVSGRIRLSPRLYRKNGYDIFPERVEVFRVLTGTSIGTRRLRDHVRPERETTGSARRKIQIRIRPAIVRVVASTDT